MAINRDVTLTQVTGTLKIRGSKPERNAKEHEKLKPDEVVFPTRKSAARFSGDGFTIACVTNEKGKNGTQIVTRHPLARYAKNPKFSLKATILKKENPGGGGQLILQAQRESATGVRRYDLTLDLSGLA